MVAIIKSAALRTIRLVWLTIVTVSVLSSILVCFLWWHATHNGHVYQDNFEVTSSNGYVRVISSYKGLELFDVRRWHWPRATEFRAFSADGPGEVETFVFLSVGDRVLASKWGLFDVHSGRSQTYLIYAAPDGPLEAFDNGNCPAHVGRGDEEVPDSLLENGYNWSIALPVASVRGVPHWFVLSFIVLPLVAEVAWRLSSLLRLSRSRYRAGQQETT